MRYRKLVEGNTVLLVPQQPGAVEPLKRSPVFFNPAASVNRDVSVALAKAAGGRTFCDSMAGVGARGLRIAKEVPGMRRVFLIDFSRKALGVAKRSAALNGVEDRCEFDLGDANAVLYGHFQGKDRSDLIDLDPFGSPVRHLAAVVASVADGGMVSATATDTAVLCGVHQRVALRRYASRPLNNSFNHETAIRILVNAIRRVASAQDVAIAPVAAHSTRHYVRVYARVAVGAAKAEQGLRQEGFVNWCPQCGDVESSAEPVRICRVCGKKKKSAGPLWVGDLAQEGTAQRAASEAARSGFDAASRILTALTPVNSFPPWSFSIEEACSSLGVATVPESEVRETLSKMGFRSMRQPFEPTGLKSDASHGEFVRAVRASIRTA